MGRGSLALAKIFAEHRLVARPRLNRGRRSSIPTTALAVSVAAATLGTAIYLVSTSLPYLVDSATADPQFGALNRCLISHLRQPRAGFAVSPGGSVVAAYGASSIAVCGTAALPSDGGAAPAGLLLPLAGITAASFDFEGTLWLAAARGPQPELWAAAASEPLRRVSDFAPVALVGVANGVAALDAGGRLALFSLRRALAHSASVASASNALLACNSDGSLFSVLTAKAIDVFRSEDLSLVRSESPCQADYLWWLPDRTRALVACGPSASGALLIDVISGERESSPPLNRPRSALIPLLGTYVQSCDQLPCSVRPPQSVR
jgi:hypothetical protein